LSRDAQSNLSGGRDVVICLHELGKLEIHVELIESCVELKSIPILKHQSMGGASDIINIISTFLVGRVVRALDRTVDRIW